MFSDCSIPAKRQGAKSAHRMTDQDDRSGIVTEIADGLIGDQPANGEFVDVSPDTGFFEALGQAVHPARKDRTRARRGTGRRAPAAGSRLAALRSGRPSRQHRSTRATGPASARLQLVDKMQAESAAQITNGRNLRRTCSCAFRSAIFGVQARPDPECRRAMPPGALRMIYRRGIGRICGTSSLPATAVEPRTITRVPPRPLPRRVLTAPAAPGCRGFVRPEVGDRSAEDDGVDLAYHLLLHDLVLFDGHVPDARHVLHIDVLQRALELPGLLDRRAGAVGDVEVYVASHASRKAGAKDRIQADCQLNGSAELIQPRRPCRAGRSRPRNARPE